MKTIFSIISFSLVVILLASCDATEPIVGSNQDTIIPNLSFIVDTTYLDNSASQLVAKGTVKYNGNSSVTSPWYVEAQFYTDASLSTKLGGNYTQIGVPLSKGQSTFWTINYSSSNVDVRNYPSFSVSNLRGIYK
ncbi:MAG: hypothetical protein A2315_03100 [Ignavibacteria bacterium RIFOXYB2_FULL_35_12]|nr:MAG: hypothetical protein A2058_05365 [Ignavibacteria bacterium GWA2_36_19]OGU54288.1 MAG: hypothetical protein A2006_02360 [Ignavibacteria bacterium GWC2_35_8]OGU61701.1 MAG: hypothetical protein A2X60_03665 [Ignavibacteria bacterium GWF2_35_20]OGU78582.1 MAG: hypothetical protein A2254_07185 [Ignavibacteria bacterium RIFOXYA2_FULL_35_9]OGU85602.1 MAG: hypothetical protein A3K31_15300 [Ignavibacteria bacterium RIFOXYA12_FULL_35_25]OGU96301.1 MAG: hypothetical protein A2347_01970 [Ignavibac